MCGFGLVHRRADRKAAAAAAAADKKADGPKLRGGLFHASISDPVGLSQRRAVLRSVFDTIDSNKNGVVDRDELAVYVQWASSAENSDPLHRRICALFLEDDSLERSFDRCVCPLACYGVAIVLRALPCVSALRYAWVRTRFDTNKDNMLSFEEFCHVADVAIDGDQKLAAPRQSLRVAAKAGTRTPTPAALRRLADAQASAAVVAVRRRTLLGACQATYRVRMSLCAGRRGSRHPCCVIVLCEAVSVR